MRRTGSHLQSALKMNDVLNVIVKNKKALACNDIYTVKAREATVDIFPMEKPH